MMVSSFDYPSIAVSSKGETTEQLHIALFLSAFALCLGIGCFLMLPLTPHYRLVSTHYCAALLPLLFTWWGIVTPAVTYWLFQQYISTRWGETITPQIYGTPPEPATTSLNLPSLQSVGRWSSTSYQKHDERILYMMRQEKLLEVIAVAAGMNKKRVALSILSDHLWSPYVVRAAVLQRFREKQHKRAPPQISHRQPSSSVLEHANPSHATIYQ